MQLRVRFLHQRHPKLVYNRRFQKGRLKFYPLIDEILISRRNHRYLIVHNYVVNLREFVKFKNINPEVPQKVENGGVHPLFHRVYLVFFKRLEHELLVDLLQIQRRPQIPDQVPESLVGQHLKGV